MVANKKIYSLRASLCCKCPSCGKGVIYSGLLDVRDKCKCCGLNLKDHDSGDGPAFFAMFIVGIIITFAAGFVEIFFEVSMVFHMFLWTPLIIILSIWLLRVIKSYLIYTEYHHNILGTNKKNDL